MVQNNVIQEHQALVGKLLIELLTLGDEIIEEDFPQPLDGPHHHKPPHNLHQPHPLLLPFYLPQQLQHLLYLFDGHHRPTLQDPTQNPIPLRHNRRPRLQLPQLLHESILDQVDKHLRKVITVSGEIV